MPDPINPVLDPEPVDIDPDADAVSEWLEDVYQEVGSRALLMGVGLGLQQFAQQRGGALSAADQGRLPELATAITRLFAEHGCSLRDELIVIGALLYAGGDDLDEEE